MSDRRTPVLPLALCLGIAVFAVIVAAYFIARTPDELIAADMVTPATPVAGRAERVEYTLAQGANADDVAKDLEALGIIRSARQFRLLVRLMGLQDQLSAGDYELPRGSSTLAAIDELTVKESGPVKRVTFPEGIRVEEMAQRAENAGFGTKEEFLAAVLAAQVPPDIAAVLPPANQVAGYRLQGYLFPDTYILPEDATPAELVDLMVRTFAERVTPEMRAAAEAKGLTVHQLVTLASIVEREAVIQEERPVIAGVFLNRIAAGDLIGADPTTQFAVALDAASVAEHGYWKTELTLEDLAIDSPYNTRKVAGLPPGPITNPGLASLEAVATAPPTEYYYFVADAIKADGSHVFAVTFAEHEANIAQYGSP